MASPAAPTASVSAAFARRVALASQGFGRRPTATCGPATVASLVDRLGYVQLDSVNVVARAHELPAWSRLGAHRADALGTLLATRRTYECWAHEASVVPVDLQPALRWRTEAAAGPNRWGPLLEARRPLADAVLAEIADRGPLAGDELSMAEPGSGGWWNRSPVKVVLEALFATGHLATHARRGFVRVYDLAERVLPAAVLDAPTPPRDEALRTLLRRSAAALGVGTSADLADVFRLVDLAARPRLDELVEAGELVRVTVEGWDRPAFLHPSHATGRPRHPADIAALVSPFDNLICFRPRAARLFGVEIRLEIYTPEPKRVHGYYVLPFVLGDAIVARVDLKADRRRGVLEVLASWLEPGHAATDVVPALADELVAFATWRNLGEVAVAARGDLARPLAHALRTAATPAPADQ